MICKQSELFLSNVNHHLQKSKTKRKHDQQETFLKQQLISRRRNGWTSNAVVLNRGACLSRGRQ